MTDRIVEARPVCNHLDACPQCWGRVKQGDLLMAKAAYLLFQARYAEAEDLLRTRPRMADDWND